MHFGVTLPNFHYGARPSAAHMLAVVRAAEAAGFQSIWATDHLLVGSAFPRYGTLFESLTTLAWVAGQTDRLTLGTSVLVLPLRNAIAAAKQLATIDALANGRLIVAVGVGWLEAEYGFLGADFHRRGRLLDEGIDVLRNLWSEARPTHASEHYTYADTMFFPKPVQGGGPPIWIGGNSDAALRRAASRGDGWHADEVSPEDFARGVTRLGAAGRQVAATIRYSVDMRPALRAATSDAEPNPMKRSFADMRAHLDRYRECGASHFICQFEHGTEAEHIESIRAFGENIVAVR